MPATFDKASWNLCAHSLPDEAWAAWAKADPTFPKEGAGEAKLLYLSNRLEKELEKKNLTPPDRDQKPKFRPDLNKYRPWALNRILRQMLAQVKDKAARFAYILPEDLELLANDLGLYRKFNRELDVEHRNITQVKDLDTLRNLVKPHQAICPLTLSERFEAHARYLGAETKEALEYILPQGWSVSESEVKTDDGRTIRREKGAKLIARLQDGTQVIQPLTRQASCAYGTTNWCTARENENNAFEDYKKDLFIIIDPDGGRWQVHFGFGQIADANDYAYDLGKLLGRHSGLANVLAPYYLKTRPSLEISLAFARHIKDEEELRLLRANSPIKWLFDMKEDVWPYFSEKEIDARLGKLSDKELNAFDEDDCNPLHSACLYGALAHVKKLVGKFHVDVNAQRERGGETPLMSAGEYPEIVSYLLQRPDVDLSRRNRKGKTAFLHLVDSQLCRNQIIQPFLERKDLDINEKDPADEPVFMVMLRPTKKVSLTNIEATLARPDHDLTIRNSLQMTALLYAKKIFEHDPIGYGDLPRQRYELVLARAKNLIEKAEIPLSTALALGAYDDLTELLESQKTGTDPREVEALFVEYLLGPEVTKRGTEAFLHYPAFDLTRPTKDGVPLYYVVEPIVFDMVSVKDDVFWAFDAHVQKLVEDPKHQKSFIERLCSSAKVPYDTYIRNPAVFAQRYVKSPSL